MTIPAITVEELAQWRADERDFVLLDVREPDEVAAAEIPGSLHIPMREIPARLADVPADRDVAVLCHLGGRSERVTAFLHSKGYTRARNVEGGIDEYANRIDRSIPTY